MKHVRPTDYYAEMLKTDGHMYKVRQQIALDKKKIEIKEQRRTQRGIFKSLIILLLQLMCIHL